MGLQHLERSHGAHCPDQSGQDRGSRMNDILAGSGTPPRGLVGSIPAIIYSRVAGGNCSFTFMSGNVEERLGHDPSAFVADPGFWRKQIHPDDLEGVLAGVSDLFEQGRCMLEYRLRHRDGTYRWMLDEMRLTRETAGNPVEIVGCLVDVTERRHVERALAEAQRQTRDLIAHMTEVEEAERRQVTRELHEQAGQNLSALSINLNLVRNVLPADVAQAVRERLKNSSVLVEEITRHIRHVIAELRPPVLDDYGLEAALRWYCKRFSERTGIRTEMESAELSSRLSMGVESTLFRLVQEALDNVERHADAGRATVTLEDAGGLLRLVVADDGRGFDLNAPAHAKKRPAWGLIAIRERAAAIGGRVSIESEPGEGTRIMVEVAR